MTSSPATRKPSAAKASGKQEPLSLRAQLKQITRERLVDCAVSLFAEKGYRATSVAEIASAAGTTSTTFYRYFPTKSDIARLLQDRINVEVKNTLDVLDQMKRPTRAAVRDWVDQYAAMWSRQHELCAAFWEATSTDPALAAELVPITERLTDSLEVVRSIPDTRARKKFQSRLVMMYLLMDRLFYLVEIQGRNATAMRMRDEFTEILWDALFAADATAGGAEKARTPGPRRKKASSRPA